MNICNENNHRRHNGPGLTECTDMKRYEPNRRCADPIYAWAEPRAYLRSVVAKPSGQWRDGRAASQQATVIQPKNIHVCIATPIETTRRSTHSSTAARKAALLLKLRRKVSVSAEHPLNSRSRSQRPCSFPTPRARSAISLSAVQDLNLSWRSFRPWSFLCWV